MSETVLSSLRAWARESIHSEVEQFGMAAFVMGAGVGLAVGVGNLHYAPANDSVVFAAGVMLFLAGMVAEAKLRDEGDVV